MDSVFFFLSKIVWAMISPSTGLILLPAVAYLLRRFGFKRLSQTVWSLAIGLILLIGFFPVGQWLVKPLESYRSVTLKTANDPDGIIVLGGAWLTDTSAHWDDWELNHAAERDLKFLALARQFPSAKLVFTGGSGQIFSTETKEATVAMRLYKDLGLDTTRVLFESDSRNTYENALFSKRQVRPVVGETWWLITSAYHLPRAMGVFCHQGWPVVGVPVDHIDQGGSWMPNWSFAHHLWELERVVREWVGLFVYRLTDKTSAIFPESC